MFTLSVILKLLIIMSLTIVMNAHWNRPKDYRNLLKENYRDSVMVVTLKKLENNDTDINIP